ncbi:hypothetical protein N9392_00410 [Flavobacteriaceae bacterium]|jgi:hypothetical protein|nr:hypothetical protein [Flavobacteriaceae bacterium]
MKKIIQSPYTTNKLFHNEEKLSINESLLNNFNSVYSKARFDMIKDNGIFEMLDSLFNSISLDEPDDKMTLFLDELKQHCHKILKNDLELVRLNKKYKNRIFINNDKDLLEGLKKNNCYTFKLENDIVSEILKLSQNHLKVFENRRKESKNSREDLSVNSGYVSYKICKILNRDFKKNGVLDAMSSYIGFPVRVGGCALELSVSEATWHNVNYYKGSNSKTKYFHHDESIVDPKAIIYLSDVTKNNGPVSYLDETKIQLDINGIQHIIGKAILEIGRNPESKLFELYNLKGRKSFESEILRLHFSRLPNTMKHNSHFGWDVVIESEDEKLLLDNEKQVIGSKGTCLLFDGSRLLHRGGIVKNNERISLQIIFKHSKELQIHRRILAKLKSYLNFF